MSSLADQLLTPSPAWREGAACRGEEVELFFSKDQQDQDRAIAMCESCPMLEPCREAAYEAEERFGIWGGTTETERRRFFRERRRQRREARKAAQAESDAA